METRKSMIQTENCWCNRRLGFNLISNPLFVRFDVVHISGWRSVFASLLYSNISILMAYSVLKHWRHMKVLLLFWGACLGVHMGRGDYFYRPGCNMKQRPQSGCINNCFSQTRCLFTFHGDGLGSNCPWSTSSLYLILKKRLPGQLLWM